MLISRAIFIFRSMCILCSAFLLFLFAGISGCNSTASSAPQNNSGDIAPPISSLGSDCNNIPLVEMTGVLVLSEADCSREALNNAVQNAAMLGGTTKLQLDCGEAPIMVTEPIIFPEGNYSIVIDGAGVTLRGDQSQRIFHKMSGVHLTLQRLTLENGFAAPFLGEAAHRRSGGLILADGFDSGFFVGGSLTLIECTLQDGLTSKGDSIGGAAVYLFALDFARIVRSTLQNNEASVGGAIALLHTTNFEFTNSVCFNNRAQGGGGNSEFGGCYYNDREVLGQGTENQYDICGVLFEDNYAGQSGGAMNIYHSIDRNVTHHIRQSTFRNNQAADSGAIWLIDQSYDSFAPDSGQNNYIISDSTFENNHAADTGGAIRIHSQSPVTLYNNTFFENSSDGTGGAITSGGFVRAMNNTFANNTAGYSASAIFSHVGNFMLYNSVFIGNQAASADLGFNVAGLNEVDCGNNAASEESDPSGPETQKLVPCATVKVALDADLLLGPLGDNGGPTFTMPLLSSSPLLDMADDARAPEHDQRREPRVDPADIGAFELQ